MKIEIHIKTHRLNHSQTVWGPIPVDIIDISLDGPVKEFAADKPLGKILADVQKKVECFVKKG